MIYGIMNHLEEYIDIEMENSTYNTYIRKYQLLLERCEVLQQVNVFFQKYSIYIIVVIFFLLVEAFVARLSDSFFLSDRGKLGN